MAAGMPSIGTSRGAAGKRSQAGRKVSSRTRSSQEPSVMSPQRLGIRGEKLNARGRRLGAQTLRRRDGITEQENPASARLDAQPAREILRIISREDRKVAPAVGKVIPRIVRAVELAARALAAGGRMVYLGARSEEHTSELQSRLHLVCRLLLEKKKRK